MNRKNTIIESMVEESVKFVRSKTSLRPKIAVILGSGLGDFADLLDEKVVVPASSIPHYPLSTVAGHKGNLIFGKLDRTTIVALQGRIHFYETGELETVLYPIRVIHRLNIKSLLVTNAAGGLNRSFLPGDLMLILDQINLTFENPDKGLPLRLAHTDLYDAEIMKSIEDAASGMNISLKKGVYCGIKGPSYETAAEVRMISHLGADAVGMSTVNEVSLAKALGMRIGGISCITNMSTGILDLKLSHDEVTEIANRVKDAFGSLLKTTIRKMGN